jgi:radical SAM superfamily enzyme YgiQ (UPF0313 family)
MKILLIDPPWYTLQGVNAATVSLGLAAIAGVLEDRGHEVALFNGDLYGSGPRYGESTLIGRQGTPEGEHPAYQRLREVLRQIRPEAVGITCMTAEFPSVCVAAQIVRAEDASVPVVVGGVHPTLVPEEVLEYKCFDYVAIGEGEETAAALFALLASGGNPETVAGIAYRRAGAVTCTAKRPLIEDLDALPLPSYRGLIDRDSHIPADLGGVITSRGCPYPCLYCASKKLWTRRVRIRSVSRVLEEIAGLYREGVRLFRFQDDTFTIRTDRVLAFCDGMKNFSGARWSCDTRVDLLEEGLARKMRAAGCYQINLGIESGSERIRNLVAKKVDIATARRLVRMLKRCGIRVTAYFMIGLPTETGPEMDETLALARALAPDTPLFSVFTPYPGTELWDELRRAGKIPEKPDYGSFYHHSATMNFSAMGAIEFSSRLQTIHAYEQEQVRGARQLYLLCHPLRFVADRRVLRPQLTRRFSGERWYS